MAALQSDPTTASASQPPAFADRMRAFLAEAKGLQVHDVGLAFDRVLYIPAYKSRRMLEHAYHHHHHHQGDQTNGATATRRVAQAAAPRHLVTLRDPRQPAVPVTHVEYGRRYVLHLQGFAPHADVRLRAVESQDWEGRVLAAWPLFAQEEEGPDQQARVDAGGEAKVRVGVRSWVDW